MKAAKRIKKTEMMKAFVIAVFSMTLLLGCDQRSTTYVNDEDHTPPPVPTGVSSVTGDNIIWVSWDPIRGVPDLYGYKVWRSLDNATFYLQATVGATVNEYEDDSVINGHTYYYGVSAIDDSGNESEASFDFDIVFDTPRPEGFDEVIYDFNDPVHVTMSGFDFSQEEAIPYNIARCDIFLEYDDNLSIPTFFIWLGDNGRYIQDMGYTDSFDDITYAPDTGWSLYDYFEAIEGHTYVIQTWDDHYVKVRITLLDSYPNRLMVFDWGYQVDPGNRELKIEPRTLVGDAADNGAVQ